MNPSDVAPAPHWRQPGRPDWSAALTIAGSDSCGGAGIQADLATFVNLGVFGASAIVAITAQNTRAVSGVEILPETLVTAQIRAVFEDLPVAAVKTGMLGNAATIDAVTAALIDQDRHGGHRVPLVVDPVMVATSGSRLLDAEAMEVLSRRLLPRACLVTPNLPEARALTGLDAGASLSELAAAVLGLGCEAVVLKGGHGETAEVTDVLMDARGERRLVRPRIPGRFHGTGCCLSAAIAAKLALGRSLDDAVDEARQWLQELLERAHRPLAGDLGILPFESAGRG